MHLHLSNPIRKNEGDIYKVSVRDVTLGYLVANGIPLVGKVGKIITDEPYLPEEYLLKRYGDDPETYQHYKNKRKTAFEIKVELKLRGISKLIIDHTDLNRSDFNLLSMFDKTVLERILFRKYEGFFSDGLSVDFDKTLLNTVSRLIADGDLKLSYNEVMNLTLRELTNIGKILKNIKSMRG